MTDILSYLLNPNKSGVYFETILVKFSAITDLIKEINAFDNETKRQPRTFKLASHEEDDFLHFPPSALAKNAIEDLRVAVDHLSISEPSKGPLVSKLSSLRQLGLMSTTELGFQRRRITAQGSYFPGTILASDHLAFLKTNDVINVKKIMKYPQLSFDICSVTENGCKIFEDFIKDVPIINKSIQISKRTKKHSSRYCYDPYPASVLYWVCSLVNNTIPEDILNYFTSSVAYFEKGEWRISIILAAIAVESLLAEMYEEYYHDIAPSDPLGALKDSIEKKQKFPSDILKDIEMVNHGRISAVHRGSNPVGERETRNTLIGATRFTQWVYDKGPLNC